jgi:glycosyltransferase involved in cell wall biosynthesis
MGSGCVVIASSIDNNQELITNDKDGYTFDLRKNGLLEVYKDTLAKNLNELNNIHQNAILKIEQNYKLEVIMKEIISDFESVVD